jgi:hypothetical protein
MRDHQNRLFSSAIWTGLNIDYPGHSFSHLGMFYGESAFGLGLSLGIDWILAFAFALLVKISLACDQQSSRLGFFVSFHLRSGKKASLQL